MDLKKLLARYRVDDGKAFSLSAVDPGDGEMSKEAMQALLDEERERLSDLQEKLYAQDKWGLVVILQAMDAAGKDGAIKHVLSGINPAGCEVHSFKSPTSEELDHDFLWRAHKRLPQRGKIGIFNRSYYEEVLVVKVHPEWLGNQKLPERVITKNIWEQRYEDINAFERYLSRNGYVVRKFFLHVSRAEQKKRLMERLTKSDKNWKFNEADVHEREHWDEYMDAYEQMIRRTSSPDAPWHVLPADTKWFTRLLLCAGIIDALDDLGLAFPDVTPEAKARLKKVEAILRAQKD